MSAYFIHLFSVYGYWFIAAAVGVERIGLPVPGETTIVLAGAFAATKHALNVHGIVAVSTLAVIVGNIAGYAVGKKFGYWLICRYGEHIHITEARIKLGRYLFLKHGSKVVIFGQFLPVLREAAALFAGANQVGWRPFLLANAIGALAWSAFFGYGAFLIGKEAANAGHSIEIGLGLTAVAVFVAIGIYLRRNEAVLQREAEKTFPDPLPSVSARTKQFAIEQKR